MNGKQIFGRQSIGLVVLMLLQAACAIFFLVDVIYDYIDIETDGYDMQHLVLEALANLGLVTAIIFEAAYLSRLLRRQADTERALSVASGALQDVISTYFREWKLTPSEADVASFTIKGCTIAEIAHLRGSAEGTVKTHLNSIYRKAGVTGRAQLVNLLIEELMGGPVGRKAASATPPAVSPVAIAGEH